MPRATVSTDTIRHELDSCPGGYVILKPMPYGTKLGRSEQAMKMTLKNETGPRRRGQTQTSETEISMLQKAATLIDFRSCVVEHNLTKAGINGEDVPLDLGNQADFESLDPRIGEEISKLIDDLNNWESGEEPGNSQ